MPQILICLAYCDWGCRYNRYVYLPVCSFCAKNSNFYRSLKDKKIWKFFQFAIKFMLNFNFKIWDYYLFGYEEESREIIFRKWQTPFIFFRWKEIRISFEVIGRKLRFDPTHFSNNLPNDRFNKSWKDACHSMIRPI